MPGNAAPSTIARDQSTISQFVAGLAQATGLDPKVVAAWVQAEGADAPNGTGGFNFLNVKAKGARGYSGVPIPTTSPKGFAQFYSVDDAVKETAYWINSMPNYATIRSATHLGPRSQLAAIAASPWDASHYGGGKKLYDTYAAMIKPGGHFLGINWGYLNTYFDPGGGAGLPDPAKKAKDVAKTAYSTEQAVSNAAAFAFNPTNWLRIGYIIGGGAMILVGTMLLAKSVGALNISTPAPPTLDLGGSSSAERQYAGRSYRSSREGISEADSKGESTDTGIGRQPRRKAAATGDIPF